MKSAILKRLRMVAAKELHNTRGVPQNLKKSDKFELLSVAYGAAAVEEDFRQWCRDQAANPPRYPITDYLKVVDERLGGETKTDEKADLKDPRVQTLSATVYELTGFTPARKHVADLLAQHLEQDIIDALKEFVETLDDKDYKTGMKKFFTDGGCAVVIYSRKHRNQS